MFSILRDPFTAVTFAIETCAPAMWSLTVFSNAATSGFDAQIGGCAETWAVEVSADAKTKVAKKVLNLDIKNLAKLEMRVRRCCSGKANS